MALLLSAFIASEQAALSTIAAKLIGHPRFNKASAYTIAINELVFNADSWDELLTVLQHMLPQIVNAKPTLYRILEVERKLVINSEYSLVIINNSPVVRN